MNEKDFLLDFIELYDDVPSQKPVMGTKFRDIEGWNSFVGLSIIAMIDEKYKKKITADELRSSDTIEDIFNLVTNK